MSRWIIKKQAPVLPLYALGIVWLLGGILLPVYTLWGFFVTLAASLLVYAIMHRLCPKRVQRVQQNFDTGSAEINELLKTIESGMQTLHSLEVRVNERVVKTSLKRMGEACSGILTEVETNPQKARLVRRFVNYYLPDTLKIFTTFANIEQKGAYGQHTDSLKKRVIEGAQDIATAFEKQLDSLYESDALEVDVDMDVLQNILKGEGLSK